MSSTTTGTDGAYTLKLLPGHYQVKVEHPDYETDTFEVDIVAGQTVDGSRKLTRKKGTLAGIITDIDTNAPVQGATVTATKTA